MDQTPKTRPSLILRITDPRDELAWSQFVEIYEPLVYRLARRNGFQDADARELTQEVLLTVTAKIESWDPDPARGSFRGWLFRIARNLMINLLEKQSRRPVSVGNTNFQRLLELQATTPSDESVYFDLEYKRQLFRWAAENVRTDVQDKTWHAFWSTCVEGDSVERVSRKLGMSVGSVYVARSRVMARIKLKIQGVLDAE